MSNITAIECKFITHLPAAVTPNTDIHLVKETIHYQDGTKQPNLRIIENFKRPFWITKTHYQNHKEKKESEELSKLNEYLSTQNMLAYNIASRLGYKYIGAKSITDVKDSPYLYGVDIDSTTVLRHAYKEKYGDVVSANTVAAFDIENDVDSKELYLISVAMKNEIYVAILKKFLQGRAKVDENLNYLYKKYIPKTEYNQNFKFTFDLFETEIDVVKAALNKLHAWKPDFVAIWNLNYDIPFIINVCEKYRVDPKDIFSDPDIPEKLRYFNYNPGPDKKVTESGVHKPYDIQERWPVVTSSSSFYWIDAMCAYYYIRVGSKLIPGGYSLNNVLEKVLGADLKKLKFEDDIGLDISGVDWHKYMVANKPLEYIIYNVWDVLSMLELDNKTKDLSNTITAFAFNSSYEVFNSNPKKLVDAMHYYYLERGRVLGTKPLRVKEDNTLGREDWIVMLNTEMIKDHASNYVANNPTLNVNVRTHVFDMDAVSSYPSNTQAANVSKDTTIKEIINIEGIDKKDFKLQNINLFFGRVNTGDYCNKMFNMPTYQDLLK